MKLLCVYEPEGKVEEELAVNRAPWWSESIREPHESAQSCGYWPGQLSGHTACAASRVLHSELPTLALLFCCHHFEMFNNFQTRDLAFSFCTGPANGVTGLGKSI